MRVCCRPHLDDLLSLHEAFPSTAQAPALAHPINPNHRHRRGASAANGNGEFDFTSSSSGLFASSSNGWPSLGDGFPSLGNVPGVSPTSTSTTSGSSDGFPSLGEISLERPRRGVLIQNMPADSNYKIRILDREHKLGITGIVETVRCVPRASVPLCLCLSVYVC